MVTSRAKKTRKKNRGKINLINAAQIQVLHQEGKVRDKELPKRFSQYSGSLIYHWAKKPINSKILVSQRKFNKDWPRKLSAYVKRGWWGPSKIYARSWDIILQCVFSLTVEQPMSLTKLSGTIWNEMDIIISAQRKRVFDCHWPNKA